MKGAHSISTRRAYGVQRVCRVWHRARSSVYARRQATTSPCRRGPVGAAPDDVLVGHIGRSHRCRQNHGGSNKKARAQSADVQRLSGLPVHSHTRGYLFVAAAGSG